MTEQLALLPTYLTAHLQLTLIALLVGIGASIPLGILAARIAWIERVVLGLASVVQTIPSLALLAVMVPILGAVGAPSIGFLPAFVGLVLYSMLPVLRNTVTGLRGVDPACREAARGVGMTPRQQLLRVELPLALPTVIAGVRTATVWTVGIATLSTPVGAPSLGNYIFSGLQTRNGSAVLVGCAAAAGLALGLDGLVRLLAVGWERGRRVLIGMAGAGFAILYLFVGATLGGELVRAGRRPIVVGAKTFTEQYILAEILAREVERSTSRAVQIAPSLGSTVAFDALRTGDIDVYVDYSGTIWATIMKRTGPQPDRAALLAAVRRDLTEHHGIRLVGALGFENTYALAMRRADATRRGIRKLSDLGSLSHDLSIGGDYEFFARAEWTALKTTYGFAFAKEQGMDSSLMYQAASQGAVDVICAFSTDGRIAAYDLVLLEDDRQAIPPYDAIVLAGPRVADGLPDVLRALEHLIGAIDADAMRRMNLAVDRDARSPGAVAASFLESRPHR